MSASDELRAWVVRRVLNGHLLLAALLYGMVGYLLVERGPEAVPDALWVASGAAAQAIYSFLSNSKSERRSEDETPQPVEVVQPDGQPVPVEYAGDAGHADATFVLVGIVVVAGGILLAQLLLRLL